jgi:SNF2 family DNA or RNA helicase
VSNIITIYPKKETEDDVESRILGNDDILEREVSFNINYDKKGRFFEKYEVAQIVEQLYLSSDEINGKPPYVITNRLKNIGFLSDNFKFPIKIITHEYFFKYFDKVIIKDGTSNNEFEAPKLKELFEEKGIFKKKKVGKLTSKVKGLRCILHGDVGSIEKNNRFEFTGIYAMISSPVIQGDNVRLRHSYEISNSVKVYNPVLDVFMERDSRLKKISEIFDYDPNKNTYRYSITFDDLIKFMTNTDIKVNIESSSPFVVLTYKYLIKSSDSKYKAGISKKVIENLDTEKPINYFTHYNTTIVFSSKDMSSHGQELFNYMMGESKLLENIKKMKAVNVKECENNVQKKLNNYKIPIKLYDHQIEGVCWLYESKKKGIQGVFLADEMGMGKTLQSVMFLSLVARESSKKPKVLIISPAIIQAVWYKEIEAFDKKLLQLMDITVVSFEVMSRVDEKTEYDIIIVDEAQRLKNKTTTGYRLLQKFKRKFLLLLSGTPIENHVSEFINLFQLIYPNSLSEIMSLRKNTQENIISNIKSLLQPFIKQRQKSIFNFKPKIIRHDVKVHLSQEERTMIGFIKHEYESVIRNAKLRTQNDNKYYMVYLVIIMKMRQVVSNYNAFKQMYLESKSRKFKIQFGKEPSKYRELYKILRHHAKDKTIIFVQFSETISYLKTHLRTTSVIDGSIGGVRRKEVIEKFRTDPDERVIIISLKSGNYGITLTEANVIVLYDLWWNPAVEEQAISRAYRIGQKRDVHAYRLIGHSSVDERIDLVAKSKQKLLDKFNAPIETTEIETGGNDKDVVKSLVQSL